MACDKSPGEGGGKGVAPLNKGLSPSGDWGLDRQDFCSRALQGRTGASVRWIPVIKVKALNISLI